MNDRTRKSIRYFKTFEAREKAFRRSVMHLIPSEYAGAGEFWRDFGQISFGSKIQHPKRPVFFITSNPRDCLVYGTPWQVLTAALLCVPKATASEETSVEEVARQFDLVENLHQPIRTLSGGETVKVALGKSYIQAQLGGGLTIASPFSWLSRQNSALFECLIRRCRSFNQSVELLALEGEDSNQPVEAEGLFPQSFSPPVDFRLYAQDLRLLLASSLNPIYSTEFYARVGDFDEVLRSPCLMLGDNGHGKTLFAKALAGASAFRGRLLITGRRRTGPVRLLFQDVVTQTLLRSFQSMSSPVLPDRAGPPMALYNDILSHHAMAMDAMGRKPAFMHDAGSRAFRSLLEIKVILTAVRLCGRPAALILDEPDWGLSRAAAVAFVAAVVRAAHAGKTPVILISHKPWWSSIAGSMLRVTRSGRTVDNRNRYSFRINIEPVKSADS